MINTQATDPYSDVVDAIQRHGCKIQSDSGRSIVAQCPGHDDKQASLSISRGDRQPVVMCCHAGCDTTDILAAIGMAGRDLCKPTTEKSREKTLNDRATYTYVDEHGQPLFQVTRAPGKKFFQRRYENGTYVNGLGGVRRVLYRLPEVIEAVAAGRTVYMVEGEKDADTLHDLGECATTVNSGAKNVGKLDPQEWTVLNGATVVVIPDRDKAGIGWASELKRIIGPIAKSVVWRMANVDREGADVTDHVVAHGDISGLIAWDASQASYDGGANSPNVGGDNQAKRRVGESGESSESGFHLSTRNVDDDEGEDDDEPKTAAARLIRIAGERYVMGQTSTGEAYAVPMTGPRIASPLRGAGGLKKRLAAEYTRRYKSPPSASALTDTITALEGMAMDSPVANLHMRVATTDDAWWIDMGREDGSCIRITDMDWSITTKCPILWQRSVLTSPMVTPITGGKINPLWDVLNVSKADRGLVVSWMIAAMIADIDHPVMLVTGEQGSGKSTAMRTLVGLMDPSPSPTRKPPKDIDQWVTAATGSWMISLDNLRTIKDDLSDAMCRAVTGDSDIRRTLYSDGDLHIITIRRVLMLNGIDVGALRGDLADRTLRIKLDRITRRREHAKIADAWERAQPSVLGGLLDLAVSVRAAMPNVTPDDLPRLADYGRVLAALDHVTGSHTLQDYKAKQENLAADTLTGNPLMEAMNEQITETWEGSSAELLAYLTPETDLTWRRPVGWPRSARAVTTQITELAPVMLKTGWMVTDDGGNNKNNRLTWQITPPARSTGRTIPSQSKPPEIETPTEPETGHGWWVAANRPAHDDCAECLAKKPLELVK